MGRFKYWLPQTLKSKLSIALFGIGFFPYLFILIYSYNLGEEKILNNALTVHQTKIREIKNHIDEKLTFLEKEIEFLSSLDIMNDMIVRDIDKRITQVLMQKHQGLNLNMNLFTLNLDSEIIASSNKSNNYSFRYINQFKDAKNKKQTYFFTPKSIMLFTPIYSTLDSNQLLGHLFIEYAFSNLSNFTVQDKAVHSMLHSPNFKIQIGAIYEDETIDFSHAKSSYLSKKYLILNESLDGVLSDWSIIYMIKKSVALAFLDQFIFFVWTLFALGFIVISAVSLWISRRIVEPIAQLSKATKSIISTKDYTTQVPKVYRGELSELADDFNAMIRETNNAFLVLEEENRVRLLRFIQLINIFNRLIQTQTEESCISLAINELQTLMPNQEFSFSLTYPNTEDKNQIMMLYVKNFENKTSDFYGVITIGKPNLIADLNEEKFYRSIATMIMLQLDQIRLIAKTEAISRAKSTFISHMSHELRTPLHIILSSTQYLIGYENLTMEQQKTIATMESSADHLLNIINDILDLVQIEAGKTSVNPITQNSTQLETLVQDVISMLEVLTEQKGVVITLQNNLVEGRQVKMDTKLLRQILINLLSNAIKFTDEGSIEFTLEECKSIICIHIKDSGVGISPTDINQLFDDFIQVKNRSKNNYKGSGLGLVISKKLSHLFSADVVLSSRGEGKGTTATVELKKINL